MVWGKSDGTPKYFPFVKHCSGVNCMSANLNGGGGGCITLTIDDVKHSHAIKSPAKMPLSGVRLALDLPHGDVSHATNGGGGGCIRVKIAGVEHVIACKPTDEIELEFDFK
jgi:hypothetical protein